jgi:Na+-driven multidrug efflux pump
MNTEWQNYLTKHSAVVKDDSVIHFGDSAAELLATETTTVISDLSHQGLIQFSGGDAKAFLQSQLSCDIYEIGLGTAKYGSYCIRSVYFIAFIPTFGFGATTRTYVSNLIGQGKPHLIKNIQRKIMMLSFLFIVLFCHAPVFFPHYFIPMINPDPLIYEDSKQVLWLVTGSIILFSLITVWFNSVAALGKSNISFLIEGTSIFIYLVACYLFIVVLDWNIVAVWTVEYIYFGAIGLMSYFYLQKYRRNFSRI